MNIEIFIKELGKNLGIEDLALDYNHTCSLASDDNIITIQYQPQDDTYLFYAPLYNNSEGFSLEVYKTCLSLNLFGYETLGMHLGFHEELNTIILSANKDVQNMPMNDMINFLELFVFMIKKCKTVIEKHIEDEEVMIIQKDNHIEENFIKI